MPTSVVTRPQEGRPDNDFRSRLGQSVCTGPGSHPTDSRALPLCGKLKGLFIFWVLSRSAEGQGKYSVPVFACVC